MGASPELIERRIRLRATLDAREADPLRFFRFGVPRLRDALSLYVTEGFREGHLRGPNNGGKTLTEAAFGLAVAQKRPHLDSAPLPQWRGPVEVTQLSLDYPQQLQSVQPAYMRMLGRWPHRARHNGEHLKTLHVKPMNGSDDESTWSVIHFMTQKNPDAGVGVRSDLVIFDEPPKMEVLRELRKAAHAGRAGYRLIGETPTKRRQWAPLREDYGDSPRRAIRRVDRLRFECRWSMDEVADWVRSAAEKRELWDGYVGRGGAGRDPLFGDDGGARWHGDYTNTEGSCPFDEPTLDKMIAAWAQEPEVVTWRVNFEAAGGKPATFERVQVHIFGALEPGGSAYVCVDPSSGAEGRHNAGIHVTEQGSGRLLATWVGQLAPYSVGVLAAGLGTQYNLAPIDIEMKDHWGVNVVRGVQSAGYRGELAKEVRELRPGQFANEVGFDQNEENKALAIGQIQEWIGAFKAGVPYAPCASRAVLEGLLDCELDERGKVIAGPGLDHGVHMILRGQSLRRCVARHYKPAPEPLPKLAGKDDRLIAMIQGRDDDDGEPQMGPRWSRERGRRG